MISNAFKILMFFMVLSTIITISAFAEELPNPGILPDHPLYPFKNFLEKIRLWLTFDPEARVRFRAFLAEQRLAEINAMMQKRKFEFVQKLVEDYERELNEMENETERTSNFEKNKTAILEHVCNTTYKHIAVLERVLSRSPEAARFGLERAINASMKGHLRCLERVEEFLNKTREFLEKRSCTSDADCADLPVWCPSELEHELSCLIPPNKTIGICVCRPIWNRTRINCSSDAECVKLVCPMLVGNDTPICVEGRCVCGAKWQIRERKEWEKRFGEEFTNVTKDIQERIRERFEARVRRG